MREPGASGGVAAEADGTGLESVFGWLREVVNNEVASQTESFYLRTGSTVMEFRSGVCLR